MSDKEVLTKYMEIIDSLKFAQSQAKSIDGVLAVEIDNLIKVAIPAAARVSYRIQRETWDANGSTYDS